MGAPQENLPNSHSQILQAGKDVTYTPPESHRIHFPPPTLVDLYYRPADLLARRAIEATNGDLDFFLPQTKGESFHPTFATYGLGLDPHATFHHLQNILFDPNVRVRPPTQIQTLQELKAVYASVNMRRGWDLSFPALRMVETALDGPQIHPHDKKQLPPHLRSHSLAHLLTALYLAGANSYFLRQGQSENPQMYQNLNQFANVKKLILPIPEADLSQAYSGGTLRLDRIFQVVHLEPTYANLLTKVVEDILIPSDYFQVKLVQIQRQTI